MKEDIPKKLLSSRYREEMWKNTSRIIKEIEKILPITSAHLLGSFTTKKKRPADVDVIVLLQTKNKNAHSAWSVDLVIAPDNKHGEAVLEDARRWMKQKYGAKKSAVIQLK
jgi:hypothetical protein